MKNQCCEEEEALTKQSEAIVRLERKIQNQHQKFIDMEKNQREKAAVMSKLITKNIDFMKIMMLEMESKYNETFDITTELQQLKDTNYHRIEETERIKKEHEKISKELKRNKGLSLSDLQQKNFTEAIQKNIMEISSLQFAALKQQTDYENVLKEAEELKEENQELQDRIKELENELDQMDEYESDESYY